MGKDKCKRFLFLLLVLLSIIPNIMGQTDLFRIENGYSPFWLMYCYMIGAYARLYLNDRKVKIGHIFAPMFIAFLLNTGVRNATYLVLNKTAKGTWFISYISPFIVYISLNVLLLFKNIEIKNGIISKILIYISSASFGVYIIHSHRLIYDYVLKNAFTFLNECNGIIIFLGIILFMTLIYIVCMVLDKLRVIIFKVFKIDRITERIGSKLDSILS